MPVLDWIGKKAVMNYDKKVPFHLLEEDKNLSYGAPDTGNMLIQGDNLVALKALLPYYAGKVKCIYIDPPYNTGNENWVYNDNVNDPETREWLNKAVGKEAEDLSRHDKWLCMMYPRLKLLQQLLSEDGFIFISIDVFEFARLKLVMDEIFGVTNFRNCIAVRRGIKNVQAQFDDVQALSLGHEYIFLYSRNPSARLPKLSSKHDIAKAGKWDTFWRGTDRPTMRYALFGKAPEKGQWRWEKNRAMRARENYEQYIKSFSQDLSIDDYFLDHLTATNEKLDFVRLNENSVQYYVPPQEGKLLSDNWMDILLSGTYAGFDTEKNVLILDRIINWLTKDTPDAIVLDSFAGSGTTAHAVVNMNQIDSGSRRFILIEMMEYAKDLTRKRLQKVIADFSKETKKTTGFVYYHLGTPLFDELGNVFSEVKFADLAKHVFFSETGTPLTDGNELSTPFIGEYEGRGVYLLYNGILKDKNPKGGNVLTREVLAMLPEFDGAKVVYGTGCRLSEARLRAENITFRQIPYDLKG